jgi:hypothetical protein
LTPLSLLFLFFEETRGIILLFLCRFEFLFTVFLSKETFLSVLVRISECCFALLFLQDVCGPIAANGDTASIVTGREDSHWRKRIGVLEA